MSRTVIMGGNSYDVVGPVLAVGQNAPDFTLIQKGDSGLREVKLADFAGNVLLLSVVPSLDTGVCAKQTKRFNEEAANLPSNVKVLTVSVDLPWAQARFCGENSISIPTASDHLDVAFGKAYGTYVPHFRFEQRAIFVIDPAGEIKYVEYVPEIGLEPNYDAALAAARHLAG